MQPYLYLQVHVIQVYSLSCVPYIPSGQNYVISSIKTKISPLCVAEDEEPNGA